MHPTVLMRAILLALLGAAVPGRAAAHLGGSGAFARPVTPSGVGQVVDTELTVAWFDSNTPIPTGTATVDLYYTARMPPTFPPGVIPEALEGEAIALGIPEVDRENMVTWDTTCVPAGSYFVWAIVNEPAVEMPFPIVSFSPGVVTVAHPGDEIHPAVFLTRPAASFSFADDMFEIEYLAFDPDGTGRVTLEAIPAADTSTVHALAAELPASDVGTFLWDTSGLEEGDWIVRATITDARGLSFTAYGRFFLLVVHLRDPVVPDGGVSRDGGASEGRDGGTRLGPIDAGAAPVDAPGGGCGCKARGMHRGPPFELALAGLFLLRALSRAPRSERARDLRDR